MPCKHAHNDVRCPGLSPASDVQINSRKCPVNFLLCNATTISKMWLFACTCTYNYIYSVNHIVQSHTCIFVMSLIFVGTLERYLGNIPVVQCQYSLLHATYDHNPEAEKQHIWSIRAE